MSIRHPGCIKLDRPTSGWWSRILWRLMPQETRQALNDVVAENVKLVKEQSARERHFISSRQSICDQSDRYKTRAETAEAVVETLEHQATQLQGLVEHLEPLALPAFTDLVKTPVN